MLRVSHGRVKNPDVRSSFFRFFCSVVDDELMKSWMPPGSAWAGAYPSGAVLTSNKEYGYSSFRLIDGLSFVLLNILHLNVLGGRYVER